MKKLLFGLLFLTLVSVLGGCERTELPTSGVQPQPVQGVKTPAPDSPLRGGEIVDGLIGRVLPLAFDRDNVLWLSIEGGGIIAHYDEKYQVFDRYNTDMPLSNVTQLLVDKDNKKWFGNGWGNVFKFDNKQWERLPTPERVYRILRIRQDQQGKVWVLGAKEEPDTMKSRHTLWSYQGEQIDKVFSDEFRGSLSVYNFDFDANNNIWIATSGGVYRSDGQTLEKSQEIEIPVMSTDVIYNPVRNELLFASAKGYAQPSRVLYNANIYRYKDGKLDTLIPENSELSSLQPGSLYIDNQGNLWVNYNQNITLAKFDGKEWSVFGAGTLLNGKRVNSVTSDKTGRLYFGIVYSTPDTLAVFDGNTWSLNPFPVLPQDPRIWWRQKDLAELFKMPTQLVNMTEVLRRPIEYRDKKISFTGKVKSGFEWASVIDADGNTLNIWLEYHHELSQALKETGLATEVEKRERIDSGNVYEPYGTTISPELDFFGFLEFGGRYGHMGGWSYQFFITEVYPHTDDNQRKDSYSKLFENYVNVLPQEKQAIKATIDRWVSAMKTGDVEGLKRVYHPESGRYKSLLTERGQEDVKNNIMDITIKEMQMGVTGSTAFVSITEATVKPERPGSSIPGGTGIFKLRDISLKKDGEWKIDWFNFSPDPPAISVPTTTAPSTR